MLKIQVFEMNWITLRPERWIWRIKTCNFEIAVVPKFQPVGQFFVVFFKTYQITKSDAKKTGKISTMPRFSSSIQIWGNGGVWAAVLKCRCILAIWPLGYTSIQSPQKVVSKVAKNCLVMTKNVCPCMGATTEFGIFWLYSFDIHSLQFIAYYLLKFGLQKK